MIRETLAQESVSDLAILCEISSLSHFYRPSFPFSQQLTGVEAGVTSESSNPRSSGLPVALQSLLDRGAVRIEWDGWAGADWPHVKQQ